MNLEYPTLFGLILCGIGFGGAAVQDIKTKTVYDGWWLPIFIGGIILWSVSFSALSTLFIFEVDTLGFLLLIGLLWFTTKVPPADVVALIALYFASGRYGMVALLVFLVGSYAYGKAKHKQNVPYLPFILIGWITSMVLLI